jgi:exopolyphosphatase / guanosine-5'-triphosphate,3'-diphosphate pyrophosphatase
VTPTATASSSSSAAERPAPERAAPPGERRTAVIDLGSNSFRLVVFTAGGGGWWKRTDEIYEAVRIGGGMSPEGELAPEAMERALHAIELFAHFCRSSGVERVRAVATSAIRDATNRAEFLARAAEVADYPIEVLSREEEARFGYLAAVNSTSLADGAVLDLGGGSLQLVRVRERRATHLGSWRLGAVRMTERFAPYEQAGKKALRALRKHVLGELESAAWLGRSGPRLVGIGGTLRNLAAAAQREAGLPDHGVQGFVLEAAALDDLIADLARMPASKRGSVPGIKRERGDLILAGAIVVRAVLEAGGYEGVEVTEAGLREGVFFAEHLAPAEPPLFEDVRHASVVNLAAHYHPEAAHTEHVAALSLQLFDDLAEHGLHPGDPFERELLWAAARLHDVGVAIDYDDHHKHSRYLILNAGLPGWSPREVALIAQIARYHRKGDPGLGEFDRLARRGDAARLERCAALLRIAEQLERSRDQIVREARVSTRDGCVRLELVSQGDVSVARWGAERQAELFEQAFDRPLSVVA